MPVAYREALANSDRPVPQIAGLGEYNAILVYSKTEEQHEKHLREVLETLRRKRSFARFFNREFWLRGVQFVGHLVNQKDILVDPAKIEAMMQWEILRSPIEIRIFLGLAGYCRRFIRIFRVV